MGSVICGFYLGEQDGLDVAVGGSIQILIIWIPNLVGIGIGSILAWLDWYFGFGSSSTFSSVACFMRRLSGGAKSGSQRHTWSADVWSHQWKCISCFDKLSNNAVMHTSILQWWRLYMWFIETCFPGRIWVESGSEVVGGLVFISASWWDEYT